MKKPEYNPLAMSSQTYANEYGKKMKKYIEKSEKTKKPVFFQNLNVVIKCYKCNGEGCYKCK